MVVAIHVETLELIGATGGAVAGPQTVNRAELQATRAAAERTVGSGALVVDSTYAMGPPMGQDTGVDSRAQHIDLWVARQRALQGRRRDLVKIKSHLSVAEEIEGGVPLAHWWANHLADTMADKMAE